MTKLIFEYLILLIMSHLVGDYVLQIDFIAKSKGENIYHLLVHCALYCFPFYIFFGFGWHLLVLFLSHIIIDLLKAKYKVISYFVDQLLHYIVLLIVFIIRIV